MRIECRLGGKSIGIRKCYSILFYHFKKPLYYLYHTILQYLQHPKTLFLLKYYFLIFFYYFFPTVTFFSDLVGISSFFSSFFSLSPMLSVTFSLPLHFPFSMPDCLSSLWVSLVLGVAGLRWFFMNRGSLQWIVDCGSLW